MNEEELYDYARKRVKKRRKFYSHLITWVVMSTFFILLNLATSDYFWAIFPILGWGIAVAFHGIRIFTNEWEDSEIDREYERLKKRKSMMFGEEDENSDDPKDRDFV